MQVGTQKTVQLAALTIVTVVFEAETDFLALQARSLACHLPVATAHEILVIDNSRRGFSASAQEVLLAAYGPHAASVRFVRPKELLTVPITTGWYAQQVLKLLVSRSVTTDAYVVLDAKNHLVRPAEITEFRAPEGRLRSRRQSFLGHRLQPDLERTLTYFGLPVAPYVTDFTPTTTPFVLHTEVVRGMVDDVEAASGRPFAEEFLRGRLLEFFAYAAWAISRHGALDALYTWDQPAAPTVWPRTADSAGLTKAIADSEAGAGPWFSVHRKALGVLDASALDLLAEFWTAHGLFESPEAARAFVHDTQQRVRIGERRQRRKDLLPRVLRALRFFSDRIHRVRTRPVF